MEIPDKQDLKERNLRMTPTAFTDALHRFQTYEAPHMKARRFLFLAFSFLAVLLAAFSIDVQAQTSSSSVHHPAPVAPVKPVIDDYRGIKVSDPYRYMENVQDPAVQSWFKAQDDHTRSVLASIPGRQELLARIQELDQSVSRVGAGWLPDDLYLVVKQLPSDNVFKLYRRRRLTGEDALLLDPEKITLAGASQEK